MCTSRTTFYHIPKTGGTWVKLAMRRSGLEVGRAREHRRVGHPFGLKREHATPATVRDEYKEDRLSFCFVRHPVEWLRSSWAFRYRTQGMGKTAPIHDLWVDEFQLFVLAVLEHLPGYVTQLYQYYIGLDADGIDFIGRQESLADDLVRVLALAGEAFDEETLRSVPPRNVAAARPEVARLCTLDPSVERQVLDSEKWVMDTFYG